MSVVLMSKRELSRLDVLARLDGDRLTVLAAASLMNVTPRQPTSVHVCVTPKDFVGRFCRKYFRSETKTPDFRFMSASQSLDGGPSELPRRLVIYGVGGPYRLGGRDPKRPTCEILRILECTLVELIDGGAFVCKAAEICRT
jgi:hypothetical protein